MRVFSRSGTRGGRRARLWRGASPARRIAGILVRALLAGAVMLGALFWVAQQLFLHLPRERPGGGARRRLATLFAFTSEQVERERAEPFMLLLNAYRELSEPFLLPGTTFPAASPRQRGRREHRNGEAGQRQPGVPASASYRVTAPRSNSSEGLYPSVAPSSRPAEPFGGAAGAFQEGKP